MKHSIRTAVAAVSVLAAALPAVVSAEEARRTIPSIIVTAENSAPSRGAAQTPVWVGFHDGTFDIYDRDVPLGSGSLVSKESVERLAEDGNTGPITAEFALLQPGAPQGTLVGPAGPLTPSIAVSKTFKVDPSADRFFSYASMVIPSNDAFIANGNPVRHPLFDDRGRFIGEDFVVAGTEVLDAGTEANDEIAANTAFLNQGGPNIGTETFDNLVIHPGLRTDLSFPDGVLSHPIFANAQFATPSYRAASFSFRYVDLAQQQRFVASLTSANEVTGEAVVSDGSGNAFAFARRGEQIAIRVVTSGLSGPIVAAHLHNGAEGVNGPVVANLTPDIRGTARVRSVVLAEDVVGPLAGGEDPLVALLSEMAAGNIYVNIHTAANPGGEVRGQLTFR